MGKHLNLHYITVLNPITEIEIPLELWDKLPKYVYKGLNPKIKIKDTFLADGLRKIQQQRFEKDYLSWLYIIEVDNFLYIRTNHNRETVSAIVFEIIEFESFDDYTNSDKDEFERFNTLNYPLLNINTKTTEHHLNELKKLLDTSN